jgi:hypothetical protein
MFGNAELERVRVQKQLLVLQSDVNRLRLAAEWQRLRSPEHWLGEGRGLARRHPVLATALATAAGALMVRVVRTSGALFGGIGRFGKYAPLVLTAWRLIRRKTSGL